jgi:hypothetical protein
VCVGGVLPGIEPGPCVHSPKLYPQSKQNIYTMQYCSALKRKEILIYATTLINLEDIMLCEISQSQKDKYCDSTYVRYLGLSHF